MLGQSPLLIVSSNTVIDTLDVGSAPEGIEYNPFNSNMYEANLGSETVSMIGSIVPIADAGPDQTVNSKYRTIRWQW